MDCSLPGSSVHGILQANTGVGCHALLQGIFLTQGSNLHLLWLLHMLWPPYLLDFSGSSDSKVSAYNAGDSGSVPVLGRSPGEGNGKPLQYSCLENPIDSGAWWATVHRVAKSQTQLSDFTSLHFTSPS